MTATIQKNVKNAPGGIVKIIIGLSANGKLVQQNIENFPIDKAYFGLSQVDNTPDISKPISNATQAALDTKVNNTDYTGTKILEKLLTVDGAGSGLDADLLDGQSSAYFTNIVARLGYTPIDVNTIGQNNGVAPLDSTGKVPAANLPSYVDDVVEYGSFSLFPTIGDTGKLYVSTDDSRVYRWTGSTYVNISTLDATSILDEALALAVALG